MKSGRLILLFAAALLAGCFKDVSHKTTYILKPLQQQASGDAVQPIADARAYAFDADTTAWTVSSYEDALAGIITPKSNFNNRFDQHLAVGQPYEQEGSQGWLQMALDRESQMILAVDPVNKLYAYTQQILGVNLPRLYVSLVFKPWKEGFSFQDGNWSFYNKFYVPPVFLECFVAPSQQIAEGGEPSKIEDANLKIYAFAADTTAWRLASYADALAGKITSKTSTQTRSNPDFPAYAVPESDVYSMEVSKRVLMVVVVDKLNKLYAYSKQEVDLEGESPTFPIVFRTWQQTWISVQDGWRVVNEQLAPKTPETSKSPAGIKR